MGLKRDSMALSEEEKEVIAYHEGGHAVLAYVLDHADPVHKVTILPTGMALGVTQQLPTEERHIYKQEYIADSIVVALGGRIAEELVFGHVSTGAQNDLVRITEMARKMVREWGMSERIGPMAWGSQGPVFLGEDLVHTRDYSDETARVIDEEVERILRQEESPRPAGARACTAAGLDAVAQALLEHETDRRRRGRPPRRRAPWAARPAATARSASADGSDHRGRGRPERQRRARSGPQVGEPHRPRDAAREPTSVRALSPSVGLGRRARVRARSATAAHRSVARGRADERRGARRPRRRRPGSSGSR